MRLFQTARRFGMEVQPQLVLLQKTLLNIEGLGRQLDDELDLWDTAKPFLEDWMQERVGPKGLVKKVKENMPFWMEQAPEIPGMLHSTLNRLNHQGVSIQSEQLARLEQAINKQSRHHKQLALGFALIVFGLFMPFEVDYYNWVQIGLLVTGGYLLLKK